MDKVTVKTKQFGEISKLDNGNFSMTDAQVYAQLEECGLPNAKEVMKTVKAAKEKFAAKAYEFLGEQLKDTLEDQTLVAGTGDNRFEFGLDVSREVNTPGKQGEAPQRIVKYAYATYKEQHRIPDAWKKNDGYLAKLADEVEALVDKKK